MLFTIAISLLYVEIKESIFKEIFKKNIWNNVELRSMVVLSLILQFFLVYFGRKRSKYTGQCVPVVAMGAWLVYLSANWVATLVLSTLLRRGRHEVDIELVVFWTPFLLWHLGNPYNITAYSIEDNELWLRHFLGMMIQIGEAIYIYVRFRSNSVLNALALPLFISGIIKCGQRVWALRCASLKELIDSCYSTPKNRNGSYVLSNQQEMIRTGLFDLTEHKKFTEDPTVPAEVKFLRVAHKSFDIFKPLFLDLPFQISQEFYDQMVFLKLKPAEEAFNLVRIELEFLYQLLYTKNPVQYRRHVLSLILDIISVLSVVVVLVAFSALLHKIGHSKVDIAVTYLLLIGAIYLEIFSFFMHSRSKWAMLRFAHPGNKLGKLYHKLIVLRLRSIKSRKGIKQMAQHDLIEYCVKANANKFTPIIKLIDTRNLLQRFWHSRWKPVDRDLKEFIYGHLQGMRAKFEKDGLKLEHLHRLFAEKGDNVIKEKILLQEDEYNKMDSSDFTRRIFVWHVATALVYYDDVGKHKIGTHDSIVRIGKSLSDYMMYLVLVRPTMLPNGFSEMINKETYLQTQRFAPHAITKNSLYMSLKQFISGLLSLHYDIELFETGVLLDGQKLAHKLQDLVRDSNLRYDDEEKWRMMSEVWMEMMVYAASRCTWKEHAHQLRHGGELITHVSLLMAHLGLSTQIHRLQRSYEDHCGQLPYPADNLSV